MYEQTLGIFCNTISNHAKPFWNRHSGLDPESSAFI